MHSWGSKTERDAEKQWMIHECYWLCAGWSSVDLDEPHFEALVHHEVKSKELEALVGQVLGADCWLNTRQTAPVKPDSEIILSHLTVDNRDIDSLVLCANSSGTFQVSEL